jgi:hypothetical protein
MLNLEVFASLVGLHVHELIAILSQLFFGHQRIAVNIFVSQARRIRDMKTITILGTLLVLVVAARLIAITVLIAVKGAGRPR